MEHSSVGRGRKFAHFRKHRFNALASRVTQVRFVSVQAKRPNHPSRCHARKEGGGGGQRVGEILHNMYMTPLGRFDLQSRSA